MAECRPLVANAAATTPRPPPTRQNLASLIQSELVSTVSHLVEEGERTRCEVWRVLQDQVGRLAVQERVQSAIGKYLVVVADTDTDTGTGTGTNHQHDDNPSSGSEDLHVEVLDHHSVTTRHGYCFQSAHLRLLVPANKLGEKIKNTHKQGLPPLQPQPQQLPHLPQQLPLLFRYERLSMTDSNDKMAPTVSYIIDMIDEEGEEETSARSYSSPHATAATGATTSAAAAAAARQNQLVEKLLWIQVWPARVDAPSPTCVLIDTGMMDEEQGDLMDESNDTSRRDYERDTTGRQKEKGNGKGEDKTVAPPPLKGEVGPKRKKLRTDETSQQPQRKEDVHRHGGKEDSDQTSPVGTDDSDDDDHADRFVAGVDIDLLDRLRSKLGLTSLDDWETCRFLFKFPFYECEWDLEGMLFDAIFADEGDEDDDDDDEVVERCDDDCIP
jgi:hypothetical protein